MKRSTKIITCVAQSCAVSSLIEHMYIHILCATHVQCTRTNSFSIFSNLHMPSALLFKQKKKNLETGNKNKSKSLTGYGPKLT